MTFLVTLQLPVFGFFAGQHIDWSISCRPWYGHDVQGRLWNERNDERCFHLLKKYIYTSTF